MKRLLSITNDLNNSINVSFVVANNFPLTFASVPTVSRWTVLDNSQQLSSLNSYTYTILHTVVQD